MAEIIPIASPFAALGQAIGSGFKGYVEQQEREKARALQEQQLQLEQEQNQIARSRLGIEQQQVNLQSQQLLTAFAEELFQDRNYLPQEKQAEFDALAEQVLNALVRQDYGTATTLFPKISQFGAEAKSNKEAVEFVRDAVGKNPELLALLSEDSRNYLSGRLPANPGAVFGEVRAIFDLQGKAAQFISSNGGKYTEADVSRFAEQNKIDPRLAGAIFSMATRTGADLAKATTEINYTVSQTLLSGMQLKEGQQRLLQSLYDNAVKMGHTGSLVQYLTEQGVPQEQIDKVLESASKDRQRHLQSQEAKTRQEVAQANLTEAQVEMTWRNMRLVDKQADEVETRQIANLSSQYIRGDISGEILVAELKKRGFTEDQARVFLASLADERSRTVASKDADIMVQAKTLAESGFAIDPNSNLGKQIVATQGEAALQQLNQVADAARKSTITILNNKAVLSDLDVQRSRVLLEAEISNLAATKARNRLDVLQSETMLKLLSQRTSDGRTLAERIFTTELAQRIYDTIPENIRGTEQSKESIRRMLGDPNDPKNPYAYQASILVAIDKGRAQLRNKDEVFNILKLAYDNPPGDEKGLRDISSRLREAMGKAGYDKETIEYMVNAYIGAAKSWLKEASLKERQLALDQAMASAQIAALNRKEQKQPDQSMLRFAFDASRQISDYASEALNNYATCRADPNKNITGNCDRHLTAGASTLLANLPTARAFLGPNADALTASAIQRLLADVENPPPELLKALNMLLGNPSTSTKPATTTPVPGIVPPPPSSNQQQKPANQQQKPTGQQQKPREGTTTFELR